jgi:hypothetical protein
MANVEHVFVTEGVPDSTFVSPPNYGDILVDIRRPGKPVIIEGQSGTGKTSTVRKILADLGDILKFEFLTPRQPQNLKRIFEISLDMGAGTFIIDDFHRLEDGEKDRIANIAKVIAEREDRTNLPKLIIIGINNVGADLIHLVPDIAKRLGIHKIAPGTEKQIGDLVTAGCDLLNVEFENRQLIFEHSQGDYWLAQQLCKTICLASRVNRTASELVKLDWVLEEIIDRVVRSLEPTYDDTVKSFCRGRRFRPTNDPYFKLLRLVAQQGRSNVDLNELANANPDVKGSINNIKDKRLSVLINEKPECSAYFYYDSQTKNFALEDPALFFYIRFLDWEKLRERCGFREGEKDYEYDIAISFSGENRELAKTMTDMLTKLDVHVFYDRNFEDNYLGGAWSKIFTEIFVDKSRLVVCLLDENHERKTWPTFERDCFRPRVAAAEVIPIRLDDTVFVGIPDDINSIRFDFSGKTEGQEQEIEELVLRIAVLLDSL